MNATYTGPHRAATVVLPDRSLTVIEGQTYEVTADEFASLDKGSWTKAKSEPKPKRHPATDTTEGA